MLTTVFVRAKKKIDGKNVDSRISYVKKCKSKEIDGKHFESQICVCRKSDSKDLCLFVAAENFRAVFVTVGIDDVTAKTLKEGFGTAK